jgi:hypothetical protein
MDSRTSGTYVRSMVGRILALLSILLLGVATTATTGSAALLVAGAQHGSHAAAVLPAHHESGPSCADEQPCGSIEAGLCAVICAGLVVHLPSSGTTRRPDAGPVRYPAPTAARLAGQAAGPAEHPPKRRLL